MSKWTTKHREGEVKTHLPFLLPSTPPWQPARAHPKTYTTLSSTLPSRGAYSWTSNSEELPHDRQCVVATSGKERRVERKEGGPPRRETWASRRSEGVSTGPSGRPNMTVVENEEATEPADESDQSDSSSWADMVCVDYEKGGSEE